MSKVIKILKTRFSLIKNINFWLLLSVWGISTFFFFYEDQLNTVSHSVFFWKSILHGNIVGGYQDYLKVVYSEIPHRADFPMVYEPMAYILVGILSFPLVLLNQIGRLDFWSPWFNLYVKLEQVLMVLGSAYVLYKICLKIEVGLKRAQYAVFLFLSSVGIVYFAIVIGQIEIYVVFFSLWGIYYWLKQDNLKFILFFAIAIPLKFFSLLIFFPLILIRQKNVLKVIVDLFAGCSLHILCKIIWSGSEAYKILTFEPSMRMVDAIKVKQLAGGLSGGEGIPIFICLYLLLCFYVFISKKNDGKWGIYCSFVVFALLFIFVGHYPYWIIILTPFLPILIAADPEIELLNLLADVIMWSFYMLSAIFYHQWVTKCTIFNNIFANNNLFNGYYKNATEFLTRFQLDKYAAMFVAGYVAALVVLIVINYPRKIQWVIPTGLNKTVLNSFRILIPIPFLLLIVYGYYKPKDQILIDTTTSESMLMGYSLFSKEFNDYGDGALTQEVCFDVDAKVNTIKLFFERPSNTFVAIGSLYIELKDITTQNTIYQHRIGYNELVWGDFTVFDINKSVYKNHTYIITISNDFFNETIPAYIKITQDNALETSLNYLGSELGNDIYMKVEGRVKE